MRIAIDYHLVSRNPNSGMGVYVKEIVRQLQRNKKNSYTLFDKSFKISSFTSKVLSILREQKWIQYDLLLKINKRKFDAVYFPNPPLTLFSQLPSILTIPDLSFCYDKSFSIVVKIYLYIIYFLSAHKAKVITTFSENSKKDISDILFVSSKKIIIVPPAIKALFTKKRNKVSISRTLKKYNINSPYILALPGSFIQRKNMTDLITACSRLPKEIRSKTSIVMIGNKSDSHFQQFKNSISKKITANNLVFPGNVTDEELRDLYQASELFVYPSLYEGFGLPPIEAMACGTPVIVYNNSSLPEVVGNAAVLVNNKKELSDSILILLKNKTMRQKLINLGFEQAKAFSWKRSGMEMSKAIEYAI